MGKHSAFRGRKTPITVDCKIENDRDGEDGGERKREGGKRDNNGFPDKIVSSIWIILVIIIITWIRRVTENQPALHSL